MLSKNAVLETQNNADLLAKTLYSLALFISAADSMRAAVVKRHDLPSQLVKLDEQNGILLTSNDRLVYNFENAHDIKNGVSSHLLEVEDKLVRVEFIKQPVVTEDITHKKSKVETVMLHYNPKLKPIIKLGDMLAYTEGNSVEGR